MAKVLITGASRGIGLASAQRLHAEGYEILGVARSAYPDFPGRLVNINLADTQELHKFIREEIDTTAYYGIINNVGITLPQPLEDISEANFDSIMNLDVKVAIVLTQHIIAGMHKLGSGRIINIASRAIYGSRNRTLYSAAKSALIGCTKTWALEFATDGITSNAIAPGPIATELFHQTRRPGSTEELQVISSIPVQRLGKPEEIAHAVSFLLSPMAGFITGHVLNVDGGSSLGGR